MLTVAVFRRDGGTSSANAGENRDKQTTESNSEQARESSVRAADGNRLSEIPARAI